MTQTDLDLKSQEPHKLLIEIRTLIEEARRQTAAAVNIGLTVLYWRVGKRIHLEVLDSERAAYGEQIVATLSRQLVAEYGRGYTEKNLRRMIQFAEAFPEEEIVATLWRQLSWSHFRELLPLTQPFQRDFYAEMCRIESWSVGPCMNASTRCSTSAPRFRNNPMPGSGRSWPSCAAKATLPRR
jgi:hypothetical protein